MAINLNFITTSLGTMPSGTPSTDVSNTVISSLNYQSQLKSQNDSEVPVQFSTRSLFKLLLTLLSDNSTKSLMQYYMFGQTADLSNSMATYIYTSGSLSQPASVAVYNVLKDVYNLSSGSRTTAMNNMISGMNSVVISAAAKLIVDTSLSSGKYDLSLGNTIKDLLIAMLNGTDDTYNDSTSNSGSGSKSYQFLSALRTHATNTIDVAGIINEAIRGTVGTPSYVGSTATAIKKLMKMVFNGTDTAQDAVDLLAALDAHIAGQIFGTDTSIAAAIEDATLNGNMVNPASYMINSNMSYVKTTVSASTDLQNFIGPLFDECAIGNPTVILSGAMLKFSGLIAANDSSLTASGQNSKSIIKNDFANSTAVVVNGYNINTMSFAGTQASLSLSVILGNGTSPSISTGSDANNVKVGNVPGGAIKNAGNNSGVTLRALLNNAASPYLLFSKQTYQGNDYRLFIHRTVVQGKQIETAYVFHTNGIIVMTGEGSVMHIGQSKTWVKQGLSAIVEELKTVPYLLGVETVRVSGGNSTYKAFSKIYSDQMSSGTPSALSTVLTPSSNNGGQTFNLYGWDIAINGSSTNSVVMSDNHIDSVVGNGEKYLFRGIKEYDTTNSTSRYFIQVLFNMASGKVDNVKFLSADASTMENYDLTV